MSGATSYHAGFAAEEQVARTYERRGYQTQAKRWRGAGGEIDLILSNAKGYVFVEVKKSKDFTHAVERITARQMARIQNSASEFLGQLATGQDTNARIDVALVNASGEIQIIENAFGH